MINLIMNDAIWGILKFAKLIHGFGEDRLARVRQVTVSLRT
jgi:hypothetical protein